MRVKNYLDKNYKTNSINTYHGLGQSKKNA